MKRMVSVLLALVLVLGVGSVCIGQGDPSPGEPEMIKKSNVQKGQKVMKVIREAEKRFFQGFPEFYAPGGVWEAGEYGYSRIFYYGTERDRRHLRALVTYEGVLMYAHDDGIFYIIE